MTAFPICKNVSPLLSRISRVITDHDVDVRRKIISKVYRILPDNLSVFGFTCVIYMSLIIDLLLLSSFISK